MYEPQYAGPIEGWVVNYLKTNMWRVERSMERDDVLQEAYLVFLRCSTKYPVLDTPQHFMALYKMAWVREFTDLANRDTKLRAEVPDHVNLDDESPMYREPIGETDNEGRLALLLRDAPREVVMVLNLILNAPQELVDVVFSGWTGRDRRRRDGGSSKVCAALGLPQDLDVMGMVEDHFRT